MNNMDLWTLYWVAGGGGFILGAGIMLAVLAIFNKIK